MAQEIIGTVKLSKTGRGLLIYVNLDRAEARCRYFRNDEGDRLIVSTARISEIEDILDKKLQFTDIIHLH